MSASDCDSDSHFIDPRLSSEYVVSRAKDVTIDDDGVRRLAQMISDGMSAKNYNISVWKEHSLHPKVADKRAVDWIFVVDSLNFSFWADQSQEYSISGQTGYWALCRAINRAIDNGIPITDPHFYAKISEQQFRQIFASDSGHEIPLLMERLNVLRESGSILLEKFKASFVDCITQSHSSARTLLKLIVNSFPSFRDQSSYGQRKVSFYKRAQILISDIWACFEGRGLGAFADIDQLTMFADYRVPQVLAHFGAIHYSDRLLALLKEPNHLLRSGDEYEVEIRAASVVTVERIKEILKKANDNSINSVIIDFYLWDYRRENSEAIESKTPFHRVRSIYY